MEDTKRKPNAFDLQCQIDALREKLGQRDDETDGLRDRVAALEAENARLHESENADIVHYKRLWIDARTRAETAEATIERARALPDEWRTTQRSADLSGAQFTTHDCADELESALAGGEGWK